MQRALKIVLAVLGIVVVLVVAAAVALPFVIDPNDYKDEITAAVKERTGRELAIPGRIELSVFPWLGAEIGEARLSNAEGFGNKPFAEIQHALVRVRLLPLISQRIEIGTVTLDGMRLRLARDEAGRSNWQDLVEKMQSDQPAKEPAEPAPKEGGGFTMSELEIGGVEVRDAAVSWHDRQAGQRYELTQAHLTTGRFSAGQPVKLDAGFTFDAADLGLRTDVTLAGEIEPDLETQFYQLRDLGLQVTAEGEAVPGGKQTAELTGGGELDLQAGRLKASDLNLQAAGVTVTAEADGNDLLESPAFNGRLTVEQFNPRTVLGNLDIDAPATRASEALTSAGMDARFDATLDRVALKQMLITLDESTVRGDARVADFANPAIEFMLSLDKMNIDRYLPPADDSGGDAAPASESDALSTEIELDALKDLNANGRVDAGELTVSGLKINDVKLAVSASNGVLQIEPLGANLYDGNLKLDSKVQAGQRQTYTVKGDLNGVQFGPLLKDLIGSEKLTGLANLTMDLQTAGKTVADMRRNLDGNVAFEFRDGAFTGFDLGRLLNTAYRAFLGKGETEKAGQTPFSRFAASFSVTDGLLKGRELSVRTPVANLGGDGSYSLVNNKLDYTVNATVPEDAGGDLAKELRGQTLPIKLSGDLFSPGFKIDFASMVRAKAKQELDEGKAKVREKVQEEKQELRDKANEKLQEGLRDLFGGKKQDDKKQTEKKQGEQSSESGGE